MNNLDRRVVCTSVLAQIGVVGSKEVLVEIQPGIAGTSHCCGWCCGNDAKKQVERRNHLAACAWIREHLERPRQEAVLRCKGSLCALERERVSALGPSQEQGKGYSLGIGVGELLIGCTGKQ